MGIKTEDSVHIIFTRTGIKRMTKTRPRVKQGEFAVKIKLKFDPLIFEREFPNYVLQVRNDELSRDPKIEIITPADELADHLKDAL